MVILLHAILTVFKCLHSLVEIVSPSSSVLRAPLLLSDSRLHLFLQSDLSITKIEKCALGKTRYTVAEAIQRSNSSYISRLEDKASCDSDCERYDVEQNSVCILKNTFQCLMLNWPFHLFPSHSSSSSSGLGVSEDSSLRGSPLPFFESSVRDPELPLIAPWRTAIVLDHLLICLVMNVLTCLW